jgi:flagellar biosynthetic protein FliR
VVPDNIVGYVAATLAETAIGAIIGLAASLIFAAIELGGFIAAEQVGLAISHVFDPMSNEESSLIGQVYFFFGVTIFALVGGQHMLLRAVSASFNIVPLASLPGGSGWAGVVGIDMAGQMFVTAVRISAPAVVALMMTTIVMAIVARAVPEMNIFNIGFAVRLGVGLGVLALTVPALGVAFQKLFSNLGSNLNILLDAMRST